MPLADQLVNSAVGYEFLSFMDGSTGYHHIKIAEEDIPKTVFGCLGAIGTFEWVSMTFGLKNAGVTYQRAINKFFYDIIRKFMEAYDMVFVPFGKGTFG